jgi:hypothetical protein
MPFPSTDYEVCSLGNKKLHRDGCAAEEASVVVKGLVRRISPCPDHTPVTADFDNQ